MGWMRWEIIGGKRNVQEDWSNLDRLPWKCQHKDCNGNLLITQPLKSTSYLPGILLKLYDFLQRCKNFSELKKHHPASRVFYKQEDWKVLLDCVFIKCCDGCSLILFSRRSPRFNDDLMNDWFRSPWRDHSDNI